MRRGRRWSVDLGDEVARAGLTGTQTRPIHDTMPRVVGRARVVVDGVDVSDALVYPDADPMQERTGDERRRVHVYCIACDRVCRRRGSPPWESCVCGGPLVRRPPGWPRGRKRKPPTTPATTGT